MHFIFEQIKVGGDRNFAYLLGDRKTKEAIFIDPSYHPEKLLERAKKQNLKVSFIINTHSHSDHTNGNIFAQKLTKAKISLFKDSTYPYDEPLSDGQSLSLGSFSLSIYHTPGHCDDHIVIHIPEYDIALTGDHLFVGKIGGTNCFNDAKKQYESFQKLLKILPEKTTIWPGHDYGCRPSSTIAIEKATNPFLQAKDFASFYEIKQNWSEIKQKNGLI